LYSNPPKLWKIIMPKNAHSQSYRKMSELSSPLITLAVLGTITQPCDWAETDT
jgi:hypothetical protein